MWYVGIVVEIVIDTLFLLYLFFMVNLCLNIDDTGCKYFFAPAFIVLIPLALAWRFQATLGIFKEENNGKPA